MKKEEEKLISICNIVHQSQAETDKFSSISWQNLVQNASNTVILKMIDVSPVAEDIPSNQWLNMTSQLKIINKQRVQMLNSIKKRFDLKSGVSHVRPVLKARISIPTEGKNETGIKRSLATKKQLQQVHTLFAN